MEKLRELMKEHQDKADKKVMGEVLELLQREPGLFVVTVHATKNFFLGAENGKAAAFLYTSREYADEFVKGLEMVGVETKVLEIRPLQRLPQNSAPGAGAAGREKGVHPQRHPVRLPDG